MLLCLNLKYEHCLKVAEQSAELAHSLGLIQDDGDASTDILDGLMEWHHIPYGSRINQTDCTLLEIGWDFDMNFDYALAQMVDRGHYAMLNSTLPKSHRI